MPAHETAALRRQTRLLAVCFAVLGAVLVAVVVPVARTVLVRLPKFADIAPLALPIAIQPAIYLVQLPFAAALRGMHRARLLFFQYLAFTGTSLTGLVIGARLDRLPGAAWGLTIGSAVGLVVMVGFWWYALHGSSAGLPGAAPAEDGVADLSAQPGGHEPDLQEGEVVEDTGPAVPHRLA